MMRWVALLRAVNVGGTGKIAMAPLRAAVSGAGLTDVASYIASGNLVFTGPEGAAEVRRMLTAAITAEFGLCPALILRAGAEMAEVIARNPFPDAPGNKLLVIFTDGEASADGLRHQTDEEVVAGEREIFVHYPSGIGRSKLVVPATKDGTGRNMNTVAKLAAMAAEPA